MVVRTIAAVLAATIIMASSNAHAAMMAYLYLKGQKTGQVRGSVTQKGREDSIAVIAVDQASRVVAPPSGGQGKLAVGQIVITKEVDRSSPILRQMLDSGEPIVEATLRFWTPQIKAATGVGAEVQYYTVRLTNARITSLKTTMHNIRNPQEMKYDIQEVVTLAYERADWTWNDGGITAVEQGGYAPAQP